jgi:hypothetical protein
MPHIAMHYIDSFTQTDAGIQTSECRRKSIGFTVENI